MRISSRESPRTVPRHVLELGVEQLRHEVVGWVVRPPVDVVGEPAAIHHAHTLGRARGLPLVEPHAPVDLVADLLLVLLGDAQQHADHPHRHVGRQVVDEVEPPLVHQRIESPGAERPRLRLDLGHPPRREHPAQEAPVQVVRRRVLEQDDPRRDLHPALDQLEDRSLPRDVGAPVGAAALHVVEPAQRVEVVLLVVIQRRLVAQALPHGVRIGIDVEVVRVVVQLALRQVDHVRPPFRAAFTRPGRWGT